MMGSKLPFNMNRMARRLLTFSPPKSPSSKADDGVKHPFLIGVAGGTASGKTMVCKKIVEQLNKQHQHKILVLSQDSFYRNLTEEENKKANAGYFNFDHPDAFDNTLMKSTLHDLLNGKAVEVPQYDFKTNSRLPEPTKVSQADVILLEGILVLYDPEVRDLMNMKLFVDVDSDTRLARRVIRDTKERGRRLENVLHQYTELVKPAFEEFTLPTKKYADVIIPRGEENDIAINLIVQHIEDILVGNVTSLPPSATPKRTRHPSDSLRPH